MSSSSAKIFSEVTNVWPNIIHVPTQQVYMSYEQGSAEVGQLKEEVG